ncbi:tyrosine-type recombinase/integrase [Actinospica robiniae]|uniref:tyrosine-type recombinase/integrase n=1 Tax=Actinospica robiniae TaxID=304901 RepID=UPI0007C58F38|nr:site-specific integrase [Actinospica robiniae]
MSRSRRSNGKSSCYLGADGRWHGRVSVGLKSDGSPDRRHVSSKDKQTVLEKIERLETLRDAGKAVPPSRIPTVAEWMRTWLDTIAPRTAQPSTVNEIYRPKVERWIIPILGRHRLDRLLPDHLDEFYTTCAAAGLSTKSVLLLHQIVSRALKMALRREKVQRNVATLIDAPTHRDAEIEPLNEAEARALLDSARTMRNGARWSVALALGLRQNEALGMRWSCVDLGAGTVRVFQIKRSRYQHGCPNPAACGAGHHRRACKSPCTRHSRCPTPCARGCTLHAQFCPQRFGGDWAFKQPKSGKARTVVIPQPLIELLAETRRLQEQEKTAAGAGWIDWDLCFPDTDGNPQEPRDDWAHWKELCLKSGVREARLHDARHTAATLLLEQGVDIRVVQEILGHSTLAVTKKYTHVTHRLARDAADRMARALWPDATEGTTAPAIPTRLSTSARST